MRDKRCDSLGQALEGIFSGASVYVGGFGGAGIPAALLRGLLALEQVTDLTLINNNAGAGNPSFLGLVRAGRVRHIVCSYPRMPGNEILLEQVAARRLSIEVVPQGTLVERIRAAGAGLGPFYTPTGYGTALGKGKPTAIFEGRGHVLEQPLAADFAFVHAQRADVVGNLVYRHAQRNFGPVMCMGAATTIVEVNELVGAGQLKPDQVVTPGVFVDRVFVLEGGLPCCDA